MGAERKYTDAEVLVMLRRKSVDGIAPSTGDERTLYKTAINYFGSWHRACELAHLTPRKGPWNCRRPARRRRPTPEMQELAKTLHVAQELGEINVSACMDYVRRG